MLEFFFLRSLQNNGNCILLCHSFLAYLTPFPPLRGVFSLRGFLLTRRPI